MRKSGGSSSNGIFVGFHRAVRVVALQNASRTGFILVLKSLYYCTLATALVCQPQSVIVSPSVRTYYIVVCFTLVSLLILHILQMFD